MKQFKYFLLFILNFEISFLYFGPIISREFPGEDIESTHFSKSKDMGPCTCNLTRHCDYRCCCDEEDCPPNIIGDWRKKNICIDKDSHKKLFEDYHCRSKSYNFEYNKNNSTMLVKDHIYNIMCIQFDNSGEMEEYYEEKSDDDPIKDWIDSFFKPSTVNNGGNVYKYGQKIRDNNNEIFDQPILDEKCTKKLDIYYGKSFESPLCGFNKNYEIIDSKDKYEIFRDQNDKSGKNIPEITYIIEYNNDTIVSKTVKVLYVKKDIDLTNLKIRWKNINNEKKNSPIGYQQGTPLKISISNDYYENGFFIGMTDDKKGECITIENENDIVDPYFIRFKNNIMYSCKVKKDNNNKANYANTVIYETFCNKDLRVAIAPNSTISDDKGWISLNKDKNCENTGMNIHLILLYYKSNDKEIIKNATLIINNKDTDIISLSIKFLDINSFSKNNKNNKITSLSLNTE